MNPKVGVGVIPINGDGKILLGKRLGAHGSGLWAFPGGHLEYGEEFLDCAARELMEETGLIAKSLELVTVTNNVFEKEEKHYVTLFVIAKKLEGILTLCEPEKCESWIWFDWNNLPSPLFPTVESYLQQRQNSTCKLLSSN